MKIQLLKQQIKIENKKLVKIKEESDKIDSENQDKGSKII